MFLGNKNERFNTSIQYSLHMSSDIYTQTDKTSCISYKTGTVNSTLGLYFELKAPLEHRDRSEATTVDARRSALSILIINPEGNPLV